MNLWCTFAGVSIGMQKVCQQPNYQSNRLATLLTGQVTTSELTKGDVIKLEKYTTLLCHLGWEFLCKSYHFLLVFTHTCIFYAFLSNFLFSDVQCGENIFMSTGPFSWANVVQTWYDEEKDFEYGVGAKKEGAMIGHFTQVDTTF